MCKVFTVTGTLRECVTRFLTSINFHDSNPSRPLMNRLKYFQIRFQFRWDIWIYKKLHNLDHTVESDSAVCITLRSHEKKVSKITLRCASHRGVRLRGVHPFTESSSTVCITPPSHKLVKCLFHCFKFPRIFRQIDVVRRSTSANRR